MKQLIIRLAVVALLSMAAQPLYAQVTLGVRGGTIITNVDFDESVEPSSQQGMILGAFGRINLIDLLTFQIEAQYVEKEIRVTRSTTTGAPTSLYTFNYLELPINLQFDIMKGSPSVSLFAGTNLGTVLTAVARSSNTGATERDVQDSVNTFTVGVEIGGSIGIEMLKDLYLIGDVRYTYNLTDIMDEVGGFREFGAWKSRDIRLTAGITYEL